MNKTDIRKSELWRFCATDIATGHMATDKKASEPLKERIHIRD